VKIALKETYGLCIKVSNIEEKNQQREIDIRIKSIDRTLRDRKRETNSSIKK
jgi:hypothetical protein